LKPKKALLCGHSPSFFKRSNPDFLLLPSKLSTLFLVKTYSRIKIVFVLLKIQLSKPIFSYLLPSKLSTLFLVKTYLRIKIVFICFAENLKIQLSKQFCSCVQSIGARECPFSRRGRAGCDIHTLISECRKSKCPFIKCALTVNVSECQISKKIVASPHIADLNLFQY
jgi:hypothetical protein